MLDQIVNSPRVEQLKELLQILAQKIDEDPGARDLAQLAKQYRETLREIEEIEGNGGQEDEITDLLGARERDGKSGAVRKSKS